MRTERTLIFMLLFALAALFSLYFTVDVIFALIAKSPYGPVTHIVATPFMLILGIIITICTLMASNTCAERLRA